VRRAAAALNVQQSTVSIEPTVPYKKVDGQPRQGGEEPACRGAALVWALIE
jgi:hypothetical protein